VAKRSAAAFDRRRRADSRRYLTARRINMGAQATTAAGAAFSRAAAGIGHLRRAGVAAGGSSGSWRHATRCERLP